MFTDPIFSEGFAPNIWKRVKPSSLIGLLLLFTTSPPKFVYLSGHGHCSDEPPSNAQCFIFCLCSTRQLIMIIFFFQTHFYNKHKLSVFFSICTSRDKNHLIVQTGRSMMLFLGKLLTVHHVCLHCEKGEGRGDNFFPM